ncbi:MAG: outer rane lipase/esterase [Verrucomicrobiota bacterium]|jgi:phospholipase/lecithinase/hemolysin
MISQRDIAKWLLALALICGAASSAFSQQAPPAFTQIILFGDSLSDTGNDRNRTNSKSSGAVDYPSHTFNYDNGRFTNDTATDPSSKTYLGVWHEQLARTFLGISPATNSLGGGLNYAFGGATSNNGTHQETVVSPPFFGDVTITIDDMGKQMDDYFATRAIDPNALYIVWGGGNDLRNDPGSANVIATAARLTALVQRLSNAGAKYIMVPNVPPIGDIPRYSSEPGRIKSLNTASADFRLELNADIAALQSTLASQGFTPVIYSVDVWTNTIRLMSNGPRYGFTNITVPAQGSSGNPDQFLFWDDVHPTTAAHYQLAKGANDVITLPPPSPSKVMNVATRVFVDTGERVSIVGFIITGDTSKKMLLRGLGPSLMANNVPNVLDNPVLTLFDDAQNVLVTNDDWQQSPRATEIMNSGLAPKNVRESAILISLPPGHYTAVLAGNNGGTGNGIVEAYDLDTGATNSTFANLSTRGYVGGGDNVMIAGLIMGNGDSPIIVLRAIGPTLTSAGIVNPLLNPTIELFDGNGVSIGFNDDWKIPQLQAVRATKLDPTDDRESAIVNLFLTPGNYTAIVRGKNDSTGVALVEAYRIP